jgi:uncharacterized protein (TIGR00251 family)
VENVKQLIAMVIKKNKKSDFSISRDRRSPDTLKRIKVKPNARKSEILEETENEIKIAIAAPAQDGKANTELIRFLKKERNWKCKIVSGLRCKNKLIQIQE